MEEDWSDDGDRIVYRDYFQEDEIKQNVIVVGDNNISTKSAVTSTVT